jgi:membrane fusion protein (multidrug efflux system)
LLPNKDRKLLPGMFANVTVLIGSPKPVLSIPRTAVTYSLYGDSVYVVKPAKVDPNAKPAAPASGDKQEPQLVVERRAVKVGPVREDRVAVLSGLSAGEQVVTTGQLKLSPGAAVRVDNSQPLDRPAERPKL